MKLIRLVAAAAIAAAAMMPGALAAAEKGVPFNGLIVDVDGKPIKNVDVWVKDYDLRATSNKHGRFGLTDVAPGDTLHIKYKKQTWEVAVNGRQSLKIVYFDPNHVDYSDDEELVNTGYSWIKKRERTRATSGYSGEQLAATGANTILEALRGLVPGLTFKPDGTITLRGEHSIVSSSQPLFVVDGTITNSLDFIHLQSVDHVEVLKDAPMYGTRGANGAIIVTTKRK